MLLPFVAVSFWTWSEKSDVLVSLSESSYFTVKHSLLLGQDDLGWKTGCVACLEVASQNGAGSTGTWGRPVGVRREEGQAGAW